MHLLLFAVMLFSVYAGIRKEANRSGEKRSEKMAG